MQIGSRSNCVLDFTMRIMCEKVYAFEKFQKEFLKYIEIEKIKKIFIFTHSKFHQHQILINNYVLL